jgi:hypothetical protein
MVFIIFIAYNLRQHRSGADDIVIVVVVVVVIIVVVVVVVETYALMGR